MDESTRWRDAARLMKSRIQAFATVVIWYAGFVTASLLVDDGARAFLQQSQIAATLVILGILVVGFIGGEWVTRLICSGLPDPETA